MHPLTKKGKNIVKANRGFTVDYKQRRLQQWELLSPSWMEYTQDDSFHCKVHHKIAESVSSNLDRSLSKRPALVDLGCGPGYFLNFIVRAKEDWWRLVGLDFCPRALDLANSSKPYTLPQVKFFRADLELPLEGRTAYQLRDFDIATATFLLDEVEDDVACFSSAASVLRVGGHLVAATLDVERENRRYIDEISKAAAGTGPVVLSKTLQIHGRSAPGELFRVLRAKGELKKHAEGCGFEVIEDKMLTPAELGSRADGPGLRILVCRKQK